MSDRDDVEEVRIFLERGADPLLESPPSPLYASVKSGSFGAASLPLKAVEDRGISLKTISIDFS